MKKHKTPKKSKNLKKNPYQKEISLGYSEQLFEFSLNEFFIFIKPFQLVCNCVLKKGIVRSHH